jgi:hypothetical protein
LDVVGQTGVIRLVREQYSPSVEEPDTWKANVGCGPAGLQPVAASTVIVLVIVSVIVSVMVEAAAVMVMSLVIVISSVMVDGGAMIVMSSLAVIASVIVGLAAVTVTVEAERVIVDGVHFEDLVKVYNIWRS